MDLRKLSDAALNRRTKCIPQQENKLLVQLLHHLIENDRRRLFSALKYKSLYDYTVNELGYSEDQACRRIAALRLLQEFPDIEAKISDGILSLTNLGMVKTLFMAEEKAGRGLPREKKIEVLKLIESVTKREAAQIIAGISPECALPDRIRPISQSQAEYRFVGTIELEEKFERLKGMLAHSDPRISLGELVERLCDLGLQTWDKAVPAPARVKARQDSQVGIRRAVWERDKNCQNCGSDYALEIDHIVPQALGGESSLENMRLLCRNCNQRAAIEVFGDQKMEKYLSSGGVRYSCESDLDIEAQFQFLRRPLASGFAVSGSSGQECLGYRERSSFRTST